MRTYEAKTRPVASRKRFRKRANACSMCKPTAARVRPINPKHNKKIRTEPTTNVTQPRHFCFATDEKTQLFGPTLRHVHR